MAKIREQGFCCALSGERLSPETAQLDHITPVSFGGDDSLDNVQWVHEVVNRMKSNMPQAEFIEMCRKVAEWTK